MSENKLASTRYRILDKCFSNPGKKYFIDDLIAACNEKLKENNLDQGVSRRTILYDITHMESEAGWGAEILRLKDGKRTYYRYADTNFSIDNQPLNQAELEQLKSAMELLSRFEGMPQFKWVNELMPKMQQSFIMEKGGTPIISFDNNAYLTGIENLGSLFYHILYKRPLCITYQSYKSDQPSKFVIHPYYLKQYNNRWFLLGLNQKLDKITNLALDRIQVLKEETIDFVPHCIDFQEYFDDIIGLTVPDGGIIEKIVLKFSESASPYVLSKPLHHSQKKIEYNSGELTVSIEVIPNYELESLVLSFGERVEVIKPEDFKDKIINRLEKSVSLYFPAI